MENMTESRLSDHEVELNLLNDGGKEMPKRKHQSCLSFLQRAWGKLTETKTLDQDLDSLELYYLLGQCGNQIGGSLWPSILEEYNISKSEFEYCEKGLTNTSKYRHEAKEFFSSFFDVSNVHCSNSSFSNLSDLKRNRVKARAICIDMEEKVVSRFSKSDLKFLFDKKAIITNYPGSANNWAEGYFSHGSRYKKKILNSIVRYAEGCDNLHGFLLLYSMGGGTGSGLGSYILEQLGDYFPNIDRFVTCVYSTGSEDVITAPYNMMLATQHLINYATCVFPLENRALQDISTRKNITSTRQMNFDVNAIKTNMVPFPKMHFLTSSFSPIGINDCPTVSSNATREKNFLKACSKDNQMMTYNSLELGSAVISGMLLGRGDYTLTDMRKYIKILQKKTPFLDWSGKCVKMGLCDVPPVGHSFSMLSLMNSSSITNLFDCMSSKYQTLLNKKAHAHHYTSIEGFDTDFFYECQNTVADIREMYEEVKIPSHSNIPRLQPNIDYEYKKFTIE